MPVSYTIHSFTDAGHGANTDGYEPSDGTYSNTAKETLAAGAPFFAGPDDSHLDQACTSALDNGVDPSGVNAELSAGISLDGVDRAGRSIDRGCYEQGN